MTSLSEVEQATNRARLLLVAGKAGLKPKHLKKIKAICAKYRDAPDETLSFDSSCPLVPGSNGSWQSHSVGSDGRVKPARRSPSRAGGANSSS